VAKPSVTLENRRRRPLVLVLDYREAGDVGLAVRQKRAKVVREAGARRLKVEHARLSGSISLRPKGKPGSKAYGLPISVAKCEAVVNAEKAGKIKIRHLTGPETEQQQKRLEKEAKQAAKAKTAMLKRLEERRKARGAAPEAAPPALKKKPRARRPEPQPQPPAGD
jgi:hypothetical protein